MLKFPPSRVYQRPKHWRRPRKIVIYVALTVALYAAWYFKPLEQVPIAGLAIKVADGDSFAIGPRKLRLKGIDAPEYHQNCKDANGADWPCGLTARAALERLLTEPGLSCETDAHDRYGRSLVICRTAATPDLAAAQVKTGMAVSDEYYGIRSYGEEEYIARNAKYGIWQGQFMQPKDFRAVKKIS